MSGKHTPGPWKIVTGSGWPIIRSTANHDNVASIRGSNSDSYLISAAPELLEALEEQDLVDEWIESAEVSNPFFEETLRHKLNHARDLRQSAIAKAKGDKQ